MTLHITSNLDRNTRRRLIRFFECAWDSSEYLVRAQRIAWNEYRLMFSVAYGLSADESREVPEADPHRLARRAMVAIGQTFSYEVA